MRDAVDCFYEVDVFLTCMVWRWGVAPDSHRFEEKQLVFVLRPIGQSLVHHGCLQINW